MEVAVSISTADPCNPRKPGSAACCPASPHQQRAFGRDVLCLSPNSPLMSTSVSSSTGSLRLDTSLRPSSDGTDDEPGSMGLFSFGLGFDFARQLFQTSGCLFGGLISPSASQPSLFGASGHLPPHPQLRKPHSDRTESEVDGLDMRGQVAIITGATSEIGREMAWALCMAGAHVVLAARSAEKGQAVAAELMRDNGQASVTVMEIDLSSFASVRAFAEKFTALGLPLHRLINAAYYTPKQPVAIPGRWYLGRSSSSASLSAEGYNMHLAVGYLGHFLLTELMLPLLRQTAFEEGDQCRVINLCPVSVALGHLDSTGSPQSPSASCSPADEEYPNAREASLSLALHAVELAGHLASEDPGRRFCPLVTINACTPSTRSSPPEQPAHQWACFEGLGLHSSQDGHQRKPMSDPDAALAPVYLACSRQLEDVSGLYFEGASSIVGGWPGPALQESARDLYESSLHMVGLAFGESPRYPRLFSYGLFSHEGPSDEMMAETSFSMTFVGRGFKDKATAAAGSQTDHQVVTRIKGPEPGYVATPIFLACCGLTVLQEPEQLAGPGVHTVGCLFRKSSLQRRLEANGIVFEKLSEGAPAPF